MPSCSACGAQLVTPLGCEACGVLFDPDPEPGPFEIFGLEPSFDLDEADLKRRLRSIGRIVHPDFHAGVPELRLLAERSSALLNRAFEILLDPFLRADWLVERLGGPSEGDERQMPQAFLMEVMEWNEAMDEAAEAPVGSPGHDELEALGKTLHEEHDRVLATVGAALQPAPATGAPELTTIRRQLNAVRYLSRALYRVRNLRFGTPGA